MNKKKYEEIKKAYKEYYNSFLKKGELPMFSTDKGFWGYAQPDVAFEFFKEIHLEKYKHILDLGSGDGIIVLIASLFTDATGIEIDSKLVEKSLEMMKKLKLEAEFKCDDFFEEDFSKYDAIFINPDNDFSKGLDRKLKNEFKGKLFVYNIVYKPRLLKKGKTYWHDQIPITEYTS